MSLGGCGGEEYCVPRWGISALLVTICTVGVLLTFFVLPLQYFRAGDANPVLCLKVTGISDTKMELL